MNETKPIPFFSYAIKTNMIQFHLTLRQRYIILINSSQSTEDMLEVVKKNNAKCEKGDKQTKHLIWKQNNRAKWLGVKAHLQRWPPNKCVCCFILYATSTFKRLFSYSLNFNLKVLISRCNYSCNVMLWYQIFICQ
jgi:hypothetical protein